MISRARIAVLFALLAFPSIAAAQPVMDKPAITLDPTKAYVLYTTHRDGQAMELIRDPNAEDIATYTAARDKALAKAHRKYLSKLKDWQRQSDPKTAVAGVPAGEKPIEPTAANFAFRPIELDTIVAIGPMNRFSKAGDKSVYMQEIVPGTYTVYGPIYAIPGAAAVGACLCMGTVKFVAEAGAITDMGFMVDTMLEANSKAKASGGATIRDPLEMPDGVTTFGIDQKRGDQATDPRIGSFPVRAAVYHPAGKRSNLHGAAVDRLTEMPGVFRYERDKQIDLTGGAQ